MGMEGGKFFGSLWDLRRACIASLPAGLTAEREEGTKAERNSWAKPCQGRFHTDVAAAVLSIEEEPDAMGGWREGGSGWQAASCSVQVGLTQARHQLISPNLCIGRMVVEGGSVPSVIWRL